MTTKINYNQIKGMTVNVLDFGASPSASGATNLAAFQAALDSVPNYAGAFCPSKSSGGAGECTVLVPEGSYAISGVLVMNQRGWQKLIGLGRVTITSTSTTYIIDMASCWRCGIENIDFVSSTANVGIYMNRATSNPYCDYNEFRNVNISISAIPTANANSGAAGIYMNRCEQNLFYNCAVTADIPFWNMQASDAVFPVTNGTQDSVTNSNTVNTFIQCNWTKRGSYAYCMILDGSIAFRFINNYWNDLAVTAGTIPYMFRMTTCNRCSFEGDFDNLIRLANVIGYNYFNDFNMLMPTTSFDGGGIFTFDTAGTNILSGGHIRIEANGSVVGQYLFKQTNGVLSTMTVNGNIIDTLSTLTISSYVGTQGDIYGNIIKTESSLAITADGVDSAWFVSSRGTTASTASATPVTIFTAASGYSYLVVAYVAGGGVNLMGSATVINDSTTTLIVNKGVGAQFDITNAGAVIKATQSVGSPQVITYKVLTLY